MSTYRGRMIFYNVFLYFITVSLVFFLIIQGCQVYFITRAKNEVTAYKNDALLSIRQDLLLFGNKTDINDAFDEKSQEFTKTIASIVNCRVLLYDTETNLLADSQSLMDAVDLTKEIQATEENDAAVFSLRDINGESYLYYSVPLSIDNQKIGYLGMTYAMAEMDDLIDKIIFLLIISFLIGIIFLFVFTFAYVNYFIKPIKDLTHISTELTDGNYNAYIHYNHHDEIGDLTQVFNKMVSHVSSSIEQLTLERERLASVLASLDDGLLSLTRDGQVLASNEKIKTYFNIIHPKSIYEFSHQTFLKDIFNALRDGQKHIVKEVESNNMTLLLIGSPILGDDIAENYLIIIRNITATRQLQHEQHKFISSVSHELRTPLTTIIGYTDFLIRRKIVDLDILNHSHQNIHDEGQRLLRLVDELLTVNSYDQMEFNYHKTLLNLNELIISVVDQMRFKAKPKNIEITYQSNQDIPPIFGDLDRLKQMFINIIHNAIKYSDSGDIIKILATSDESTVNISIRDYGVGISPEELDRIFNAFYRIDEDRSRSVGEGGAGLGLYLVKQIVNKHNGTIGIDSVINEGTNLTVSLPIADQSVFSEVNP